ncbi:MAG TPA: tetratricopeptide repeat protein, partial [Thermoanaerobaculia bacterium]|nr:tetratricopeptide repeat protein [Thermoanaerobaculia bacterium]
MRHAFLLTMLLSLSAAAETDLEKGAKLLHARKFDEARETYERILSAEPKSVEAHVRLCRLYAEQLDDIDKAIEHGEAAIRIAPSDASAHFALGEAYGLKAADVGVFSAFS